MYPTVPAGQSWPRLRLPFYTDEEWTERGPRVPVPESLAMHWCTEHGLSYVVLGDEDVKLEPAAVLARFDWPSDGGDG